LEQEGAEIEETAPAEAEGMASAVLFAAALALIVIAPFATRPQPEGKAWFLAPVNWPVFSLGIAALSGGAMTWRFLESWRKAADRQAWRRRALWAFGGLSGALEYSLWFCIYLVGVAWLGFAIATLLFLQFVVWRSGLRGVRWVATTFLLTAAIVIVFRLGIGLWFPLPPLLKLMPAWFGNTFGGVL
jgi:hypothetical protein